MNIGEYKIRNRMINIRIALNFVESHPIGFLYQKLIFESDIKLKKKKKDERKCLSSAGRG